MTRSTLTTQAPLHVVEVGAGPAEGDDAAGTDDARTSQGEDVFLLLHGYGASSYMWRHWAEPLARRGRVLLVDIKGFGQAPKPDDGRYTPHDLAAAVVDFIREQDLRRLTIIGQSLGGGIALLVSLALHDEGVGRLHRLVLVAAAAYPQKLPPLVPLSKRPRFSGVMLRLLGPRRVVRWVIRSIVHDPATISNEQVAEYARALESAEGRRATFAVGSRILPADLEQLVTRYPRIDVPTLLLWGDADRVIPLWVGRRLEAALPNARLVVLSRCGHLPPEERPEASLEALRRFLDETD